MKKEEEYNKKAMIHLHRIYLEVVMWATIFGLIVPAIFLWTNKTKIPQADGLLIPIYVIIPLLVLFYILSTGEIFRRLSARGIKFILYLWGIALLVMVASLVFCTGGIQSSIFCWLFEYAFIVTLLIRPRYERKFFRKWRPVILTVVFEILIIFILSLFGKNSIRIPSTMEKSMPLWGGLLVGSSLVLGLFLFFVSTGRLEELNKEVENA